MKQSDKLLALQKISKIIRESTELTFREKVWLIVRLKNETKN